VEVSLRFHIIQADLNLNYFILGIFLVSLYGCSSTAHQKTVDYQSMAKEKYGKDIRFLYNTLGTAVVCMHSDISTAPNPIPYLNFFIFDVKNNKVLHEAEIPGGSIRWIDNYRVEIKSKPEVMIRNVEPITKSYIFDIRSEG
jgi:hypothetical protein